MGHKLPACYIIAAATTPPDAHRQELTRFVLDGAYHTNAAKKCIRRLRGSPRIIGIWHSHICGGAVFSKQDKISNKEFSKLYGGAISVLVTMENERLNWLSYYIAPDGGSYRCRELIVQNKRRNRMNGQDRCSNCIYWQCRVCAMTGQVKNDSVCNCGQFKPRA